jgi:hypothetical protein
MGNHTYYTIKCELSASSPSLELTWETQKRLAALREDLHDTVKNELGKDYPDIFAAAPFAKRGGWGGTSDRLKKWLETLADAVNKGVAPPVLVFQVLLFFEAPARSDHQKSAENVPEDSKESGTPTPSPKNEPAPVAPEVSVELPAPAVAVSSSSAPDQSGDKENSVEAMATPSPISVCDIAKTGDTPQESAKEEPDDSETDFKPKRSVSEILRGKSSPALTTPTTPPDARSKSAEPSVEGLRKSATGESLEGLGMMQRRANSLGAKQKDDTTGYLEDYGFSVASKTQWRANAGAFCNKPVLRLKLDGHSEQDGHTYYNVKCHFFSEKRDIHYDWTCKRRLGHLREDLHDRVKEDLGKNYEEFFSQAPFARRGGLSGTTGRLQNWLETLASCVNEQHVSPSFVMHLLQFFGTPVAPKTKSLTPRKSRVSEVWGDPLPEEMRVVRASPSASPEPPEVAVSREESPPQRKSLSRANSLTPRKSVRTASPDDDQEAGMQVEQIREAPQSDDDEISQFDGKKRQKGYRKLRDWFIRLKQSLSRSTLSCASAS